MEKIKGDKYPEEMVLCGKTHKAIGQGKYPYDCISKDEYPNAMIYVNDGGGWFPAILTTN